MSKDNKPIEYTKNDYSFMNSLSAAVLEQTPSKMSRVIKIWLFTVIAFLTWASLAEIDEITRGDGDVIPYGQNKIIQNLEGGIVESILVEEGQIVKAGEVILKINNAKSTSTSRTNKMNYYELEAKRLKLFAQANELPFSSPIVKDKELRAHIKLSENLYNSNKSEYIAKDKSFVNQIEQKKQAYKEATARVYSLQKSLEFVTEEIEMTAPMVKEGVKSKVDFLKLKREANGIENDIEAAKLSLPRLSSAIDEVRNKREESKQLFINDAKQELNEVTAEISRLKTQQVAYSDQVERTMVKSPVEGIVQKLFVNTVGGVIKPGADLVEIVPTNKKLYLEVKIKPSDIAFLHPGAQARVKVSAYDFAIHGGLIGKVVNISPDTITDNKENTFYIIHVVTEKNYLGTEDHPLMIIPGMTVGVDIITGQKTVMQYILKPILKSKQYVFSER
ncbi:HlyD family type I secretion periplasmic adaptor subunit [Candidatus Sulfurimonas marisnigri]|uniref:HlyD family type I secretion periplasmic adaptor subunit n=1 Tax=Candidatus Sulfurimonas marisnigri TaxID=2740405 RepID=A0A7S7RP47_9BACT|nr:HlyD family type I secretion periplasmic adaptor subunit [Candidatus Sulfurimonas marisnigri]QOY53997.1 HlyD family type I secretion periplasmic adaptor subunit [Candidatus Sulfurimonas marisnigri]